MPETFALAACLLAAWGEWSVRDARNSPHDMTKKATAKG